jgi:hypothetical protein
MTRLATFAAGLLAAALVLSGPAYPQSPSPEAAAAARELVEAARTTEQFKTLMPLMLQQMKPVVVQGRPEVERDYDKIVPLLMELANRQVGEFAEEVAALYARNFTTEEIRQVTDFYRSPVGQKFLEKTPVIAQESMVMGQKFGQRIVQDLQSRMREELRKRGHNI